jgi:hypothetical protein
MYDTVAAYGVAAESRGTSARRAATSSRMAVSGPTTPSASMARARWNATTRRHRPWS